MVNQHPFYHWQTKPVNGQLEFLLPLANQTCQWPIRVLVTTDKPDQSMANQSSSIGQLPVEYIIIYLNSLLPFLKRALNITTYIYLWVASIFVNLIQKSVGICMVDGLTKLNKVQFVIALTIICEICMVDGLTKLNKVQVVIALAIICEICMVDGLTKLNKVQFETKLSQSSTLRKYFVILQLYWWLFSSTKHCS